MTGQIPQPEWFDLTDELDRIAGEGESSYALHLYSTVR